MMMIIIIIIIIIIIPGNNNCIYTGVKVPLCCKNNEGRNVQKQIVFKTNWTFIDFNCLVRTS